jgi:hypothetical protein
VIGILQGLHSSLAVNPGVQRAKAVRELHREELNRLQENFESYIQPHLLGHPEDYDLIWGWQKFIYDRGERLRALEKDESQ